MINSKQISLKVLLCTLLFILFTNTFAYEFSDTLSAWMERGYTITTKGDYKIVEFRFNYDNIATLDIKSNELIVYTYTGKTFEKPTDIYISDVQKILNNSAFSSDLNNAVLTLLTSNDYIFGKENIISDHYKVKTTVYNQNSVILQLKFHVMATDISEQIDVEENKLLKEKNDELEKQITQQKAEIKTLKDDIASKSRTIERLENKSAGLEDSLEKYKYLSEYKESVTDNLQKTIARYKEIERQKLDEIELKTSIIEDLNNDIAELKRTTQQNENELITTIEDLENKINELEKENSLLKESEDHYKSRLYLINSLYNLKISESEIPVTYPVKTVETANQNIQSQLVEPEEPTEKEEDKKIAKQPEPAHTENKTENSAETIEKNTETPEKVSEKPALTVEKKRLTMVIVKNEDKQSHKILYEYDGEGKQISESVIFPPNQIVQVVKSKYYENGKLYESGTYQNDKLIRKTVFQYNKEGHPSRTFLYSPDSMIGYMVYEYDSTLSEKNPVRIKYFEENQLKMIETNKFDEKGNIVRNEQRNTDDKLLKFTIFEFRDSRMIKSIHYNESEKEATINYTYDTDGNLILQEISDHINHEKLKIESIYE